MELCNYFHETKKDWSQQPTSSLIDFVVHTQDYLNHFNFPSCDGLDNMRSNLFTLLTESKRELQNRGIRL